MQEDKQRDLFNTDHLTRNLGKRSLRGGLIVAASQVGKFGLYIAAMVILSRLLSPEDFGLVAVVSALTAFLRLFQEAGLSTATIQRHSVTPAQVSNLFWINCGLGTLAAFVAAASAPLVAWFFEEPRLLHITVALSLTFLVGGATVQHRALLTRQMRFMALAIIDVSSMAFGLVLGVGMALSGYGYWSLVGMQIAIPTWVLLVAVLSIRWRPNLYRRRSGTRAMIGLGASLTVASLLRAVSDSIPTVLIGRAFGLDAVGYYSRADAMLMRPLNQLFVPFDRVMVPSLSRLQGDPERYRKVFLRVCGLIALISCLSAGLFFGLADSIVFIVLGAGWDKVIPVFTALSVAILYLPLGKAANWLLATQGRKNDILTIGWTFPVITIVAAVVGLPFGLAGVAISISVFLIFVRLPVQYYIVGRSGPVSRRDLWAVSLRHLPSIPAVLGGIWLGEYLFPQQLPVAELAVGTAFGLVAAAIVILLVPSQRREFLSLLDLRRTLSAGRRCPEPSPSAATR